MLKTTHIKSKTSFVLVSSKIPGDYFDRIFPGLQIQISDQILIFMIKIGKRKPVRIFPFGGRILQCSEIDGSKRFTV